MVTKEVYGIGTEVGSGGRGVMTGQEVQDHKLDISSTSRVSAH